jgi:hypothetical protein
MYTHTRNAWVHVGELCVSFGIGIRPFSMRIWRSCHSCVPKSVHLSCTPLRSCLSSLFPLSHVTAHTCHCCCWLLFRWGLNFSGTLCRVRLRDIGGRNSSRNPTVWGRKPNSGWWNICPQWRATDSWVHLKELPVDGVEPKLNYGYRVGRHLVRSIMVMEWEGI